MIIMKTDNQTRWRLVPSADWLSPGESIMTCGTVPWSSSFICRSQLDNHCDTKSHLQWYVLPCSLTHESRPPEASIQEL